MFTPSLRKEYESLYEQITGLGMPVKSSSLLQTYATILAIINTPASSSEDAYRIVRTMYSGYELALCSKIKPPFPSTFSEIAEQYLQLSLLDFLLYVVPDLVCEPERLMRYQACATFSDTVHLVHHIIRIKHNTYLELEQSDYFKNSSPGASPDIDDRLYQFYTQNEQNYPLSKKDFLQLYRAINMFTLDQNYLSPKLIGVKDKDLSILMDILFDQLQLTRAQCFQLIHNFFCLNRQSDYFVSELQTYNFTPFNSNERSKLLQKALRIIAKVSPLEAICAISIRKKQGSVNTSNRTESLVLPNDVTLESSLIYSAFFSSIAPNFKSNIAIVFPSLCFIRRILHDPRHTDQRISFIIEDSNAAGALAYQASDITYAPRIGTNITFLSYSDWKNQKHNSTEKYSNVLLFGSGLSYVQREEIYPNIFECCCTGATMCVLESSESIENKRNFFFDNPLVSHMRIALIPQGINNSTAPKRKALLLCSIQNNSSSPGNTIGKAVRLFAYTLNTTLGTQAISPMLAKPITFDVLDPCSRSVTLRQLYLKELLNRKSSGRTRNASFPYEFTPDIQIWCSKTYPKNNAARPRLEAYICKPAPDKRLNSGYRERGSAIDSTKKHTTKIPDADVLKWLEEEYPYSVIIHRSQSNTEGQALSSVDKVTSIRDEITNHYVQHLQGKNIALKTFWYLYQDLADSYSKSAYQIFEEMVHTAIGQQRICDMTAEECEKILIATYPDLSDTDLWKRFAIISTALDKAVEYGYCQENDLRTALRHTTKMDQLFSQVRRALTKTHFTKAELQQAYRFCINKLSCGESEYLGVLIRMMTGLESSIVCALRWSDLMHHPEYDFYSFVITRQIGKDGAIIGFHDAEDYLCFPISKQLQAILSSFRKRIRTSDDTTTIVSTPFTDAQNSKTITPQLINMCAKEMITSIGISEHKVILPGADDEFRETDLNKYYGDFIRENFRYWSVKSSKLTADELAYLLRIKSPTTLGRFYCDFLNEASQLILYLKLCRWESDLIGVEPPISKISNATINSHFHRMIPANISHRTSIMLEITADASAKGTIMIDSPYGLSSETTLCKRED